jgi:hypothetical protein
MDTDPRRTDGGDLRLDLPGTVNGVPVHRRYPQPPPLVEAEGVEIVVGGYQPQPPAPLRCGYFLRHRQQGTADAGLGNHSVDGHQLELVAFYAVGGQPQLRPAGPAGFKLGGLATLRSPNSPL